MIDRLEEKLDKLEDKVNCIDKKVGIMKQQIGDHCRQNAIDLDEIKTMLKDALSQKANKWVEWPVKALIITIITSVFGIVVYLIQEHLKF